MKNVVLLHGWGASSSKLGRLNEELRFLGWRVLNLELPGFDLPLPKYAWNLDNYAAYVFKKADAFFHGSKFCVFGHSFGGRIAIRLATNYSRRLNGIVLCAPGGISPENNFKIIFFRKISQYGKKILGENKLARKIIYKIAGVHDYEKTSGILSEIFKNIIKDDLIDELPGIVLPTLIIWGNNDKIVSVKGVNVLVEKMTNTTVFIHDQEGHKLPYRRPTEIASQINLWAESKND